MFYLQNSKEKERLSIKKQPFPFFCYMYSRNLFVLDFVRKTPKVHLFILITFNLSHEICINRKDNLRFIIHYDFSIMHPDDLVT